jgi:hypothetical protein
MNDYYNIKRVVSLPVDNIRFEGDVYLIMNLKLYFTEEEFNKRVDIRAKELFFEDVLNIVKEPNYAVSKRFNYTNSNMFSDIIF